MYIYIWTENTTILPFQRDTVAQVIQIRTYMLETTHRVSDMQFVSSKVCFLALPFSKGKRELGYTVYMSCLRTHKGWIPIKLSFTKRCPRNVEYLVCLDVSKYRVVWGNRRIYNFCESPKQICIYINNFKLETAINLEKCSMTTTFLKIFI